MQRRFERLERRWGQEHENLIASLELQISKSKERLNNLTDAYLEGVLDKETFEERKTTLIMERRGLEDQLAEVKDKDFSIPKRLQEFLELAKPRIYCMNRHLLKESAVCWKRSLQTGLLITKTLKLHWLTRFLTLQRGLKINMVARLGPRSELGMNFSQGSSNIYRLQQRPIAFNRNGRIHEF